MLSRTTERKTNVPPLSHMGGVSERMIRTARSASSGLLEDHSTAYLDDEALRTLPQKLKIL